MCTLTNYKAVFLKEKTYFFTFFYNLCAHFRRILLAKFVLRTILKDILNMFKRWFKAWL